MKPVYAKASSVPLAHGRIRRGNTDISMIFEASPRIPQAPEFAVLNIRVNRLTEIRRSGPAKKRDSRRKKRDQVEKSGGERKTRRRPLGWSPARHARERQRPEPRAGAQGSLTRGNGIRLARCAARGSPTDAGSWTP